MAASGSEVDDLFSRQGAFFYIEGRDPGATFADKELVDIAGEEVARSVIISPAALHAGLIRNKEASTRVIERYGWDTLRGLRAAAIKDGIQATYNGAAVSDLCEDLVATAYDSLRSDEQWMLAYPEHVLETQRNGADRALAYYDKLTGGAYEKIKKIVRERMAILV